MLEVWLIRHGETEWNRLRRWQGQSDVELNETGIAQAKALGARLGNYAFDAVWSSDLKRAAATAQLALPDVAPRTDVRLRELHFGELEGKRWDELTPEQQEMLNRWRTDPYGFAPTGGEQYHELESRARAWLHELPPEGRLAVFTHGGTVRALLSSVIGSPGGERWSFALSNGSISRLRLSGDFFIIKSINDTAHLDDLDLPGG